MISNSILEIIIYTFLLSLGLIALVKITEFFKNPINFEWKSSKRWHAVIYLFSAIISSIFVLIESPKLFGNGLYDISYPGVISVFFKILSPFLAGFSLTAGVFYFVIFYMAPSLLIKSHLLRILAALSVLIGMIGAVQLFFGPKDIDNIFSRDRYITRRTIIVLTDDLGKMDADIRVLNGNILSLDRKNISVIRIYLPNGNFYTPYGQDNSSFKSKREVEIFDEDDNSFIVEIPK